VGNSKWHYSGDVSISYGGLFVRDCGHYFDVVEVTDLDSACGADGLVLVETGSTSHEYYSRAEIRNAMRSCNGDDWRSLYRLGNLTREQSRLRVAEVLWQYGHKDIDTSVVLVNDSPYTDECASCGESIVYRNDRWEHADADDDGLFLPCEDNPSNTAKPKAPVKYENGAESWPDLLVEDWQRYADGDDGVRRYLADHCDISAED